MSYTRPVVRRAAAFALLVACAIVLGACAPQASQPAASPKSDSVQASAPGTYAPDARVTLANGATVQVPTGWVGHLYSAGALTTAPPAVNGNPGLVLLGGSGAPSDTGIVWVFGPGAGFDAEVSRLDMIARQSFESSGGPKLTKMPVQFSADASASAYVGRIQARPPRVEVILLIQVSGRDPISMGFDFTKLPAEFGEPSDAKLPQLLLDYIGLRLP